MDEKKVREAIEELKAQIQRYKKMISENEDCKLLCVKLREKIEQIETEIEALEKQLPKKLIEHHYEEPGETPYVKYGCGNGCKIQPSRSSKYCNQCGQRIDWLEVE